MQYFELIKWTCDLCLVGLAKKTLGSFLKFLIVFSPVSSANQTSYSCFKSFTAIAASCSRDVCMREKNASCRPAALDLYKIRVCVFCVSGEKKTSEQQIQLTLCFQTKQLLCPPSVSRHSGLGRYGGKPPRVIWKVYVF